MFEVAQIPKDDLFNFHKHNHGWFMVSLTFEQNSSHPKSYALFRLFPKAPAKVFSQKAVAIFNLSLHLYNISYILSITSMIYIKFIYVTCSNSSLITDINFNEFNMHHIHHLHPSHLQVLLQYPTMWCTQEFLHRSCYGGVVTEELLHRSCQELISSKFFHDVLAAGAARP